MQLLNSATSTITVYIITGYILACDVSNNSERNGVAVVMSDKAYSALIEWRPVSEHMAYARFKGKFCIISVISVYA